MQKFLAVVFLFFVCCFVHAEPVQDTLSKQAMTIKESLADLKQQLKDMNTQCASYKKQLESLQTMSEEEQKRLNSQLTELSNSLMNTNERLSNSLESVMKLKQTVQLKNKVVSCMLTILIVLSIAKCIGIVLMLKGIKVPRWLDVIL